MTDEIEPPREGISTLGAQFTKAAVEKVERTVRSLREQGWTERRILEQMRKDLPFFPARTLQRLFDKSIGRLIEDDLRPDDVAGEREIKEKTIEIDLRRPTKGIEADRLVRYRGTDWYVARVSGTAVRLKRIG